MWLEYNASPPGASMEPYGYLRSRKLLPNSSVGPTKEAGGIAIVVTLCFTHVSMKYELPMNVSRLCLSIFRHRSVEDRCGVCVMSLRLITNVVCDYDNYYTHFLSTLVTRRILCGGSSLSVFSTERGCFHEDISSLLDGVCNTTPLIRLWREH